MKDYEIEKTKFFLDKYWQLILERMKTIIFIAHLLIALLVITSFSEKIIPESTIPFLKILIVILFFLIPVMLVDYLLKLNEGLNELSKALNNKSNKSKKRLLVKLVDGSNYIYALITIIVVNIIISFVVQNLQISLIVSLTQMTIIAILIFSKRLN